MTSIYLASGKLRTYSSTTKEEASVLKIEIEYRNPTDLGYVLLELAALKAVHKAEAKPKKVLRIADLREVKS